MLRGILLVLTALLVAGPSPATAVSRPSSAAALTVAVIGDTPYDDAQAARFPALVSSVNADRRASVVVHLGDMKSGQPCTDEFFAGRRALYGTFADPFVFTPGDNDWTDCHRPQFGAFIPTERLASLRRIFYPQPRRALGGRRPLPVKPQSDGPGFAEFVENVTWRRAGVVFSTLHVVGSNNDLVPWVAGAETPAQRELRLAEFQRRQAANLAWLQRTFATATRTRARAVVLAMQANMFVARLFPESRVDGFDALVQRIAELARAFRRPVLLLQGDTHVYLTDHPLANGSPEHGVTTRAPNVARIVVQGETADEWLRLRVKPGAGQPFSWQRVAVP